MAEQMGWQGLWQNLKNEAPRYAHILPQLPRLVHGALSRAAEDTQPQLITQLLHEQRTTNRLLRTIIWFAGGFLGGVVLLQLWSFFME